VKVRSVAHNNRKRLFEVAMGRRQLAFPYAKARPAPSQADPVIRAWVDTEIAREGFGYELASGRSGTVHQEQVLDYNQDPTHQRIQLLYRLTVEAQQHLARSPLSRREIARRLSTSATQLYRLLDQTNDRKSIDQLLALLQVLDCDVDLVIRRKAG